MAPGELDAVAKELLALSISATRECDGCIVAHARGAAREGATRQQVAEAMGVVDLDERGARHGVGAAGPARLRRGGRRSRDGLGARAVKVAHQGDLRAVVHELVEDVQREVNRRVL